MTRRGRIQPRGVALLSPKRTIYKEMRETDAKSATKMGSFPNFPSMENGDTYGFSGNFDGYNGYMIYGDEEVRMRAIEVNAVYHKDLDWSNPGCQSRDKRGPQRDKRGPKREDKDAGQ